MNQVKTGTWAPLSMTMSSSGRFTLPICPASSMRAVTTSSRSVAAPRSTSASLSNALRNKRTSTQGEHSSLKAPPLEIYCCFLNIFFITRLKSSWNENSCPAFSCFYDNPFHSAVRYDMDKKICHFSILAYYAENKYKLDICWLISLRIPRSPTTSDRPMVWVMGGAICFLSNECGLVALVVQKLNPSLFNWLWSNFV